MPSTKESEFGWLRGKKVALADVPKMPIDDQVEVEVEVDGPDGRTRPFRFADAPSEVSVRDGKIVL